MIPPDSSAASLEPQAGGSGTPRPWGPALEPWEGAMAHPDSLGHPCPPGASPHLVSKSMGLGVCPETLSGFKALQVCTPGPQSPLWQVGRLHLFSRQADRKSELGFCVGRHGRGNSVPGYTQPPRTLHCDPPLGCHPAPLNGAITEAP